MNAELDLNAARKAVGRFVTKTPLLWDANLTELTGSDLYLKLESLQVTGSFKIRGAANRMMALTAEERARGVITCSSGNHGRAVAHVAGVLAIPATICVPDWVDPVKHRAMEASGAEVLLAGKTYDEADALACELESERGLTFVHPFDDLRVLAGQGTVGLEILEDLPDVSEVLVPLSGGGLAGGIAYAIKQDRPDVVVTAVSAERAAVMLGSLEAGRPIEMEEEATLANALSGGIGLENRYSFVMVRDYIDRHVTVPEEAIAQAMGYAASQVHLVVEGGGAVALAAVLRRTWTPQIAGAQVAVVLSGGNVSAEQVREVVAATATA